MIRYNRAYNRYSDTTFAMALYGSTLYIGTDGSFKMTEVSKYDSSVFNSIYAPGLYMFCIEIDEVNGYWYYCIPLENVIHKMSFATNAFVESIGYPTSVLSGFVLDVPGDRIFICDQGASNMYVYTISTNVLIATIQSVLGSEKVIHDIANNRFIVCYLDGYIRTFDATTYAFISTYAIYPGNYLRSLAADFVNNRLYISNTDINEIYVYYLDTMLPTSEVYQTTYAVYSMVVDNDTNCLYYGDYSEIKTIPLT